MRALTGSGVLVEDKLFATLDTTVRALRPESVPRILVSDTVGFIKKLPHDLVASFRSTLEEARDCELLVHVVDASDPSFPAQIEVTREVLAEIGADESPRLVVLNKADRLDAAARERLARGVAGGAAALRPRPRRRRRAARADPSASSSATPSRRSSSCPTRGSAWWARSTRAARVLAESHDETGTCCGCAPGPRCSRGSARSSAES